MRDIHMSYHQNTVKMVYDLALPIFYLDRLFQTKKIKSNFIKD